MPKNYEPSKVVGVDAVFFPDVDPRNSRPVLNVTDWGTGYQVLEPLSNMTSEHVWRVFNQAWVRTFGIPEMIVVDQGREFAGEVSRKVSSQGALIKFIGARAPWQQGRAERHGGLAKELFLKVREDCVPTTEEEWRTCLHSVEAAKNRLFNRSGYSPAQRQIGANLRLPGTLASDDAYDPH